MDKGKVEGVAFDLTAKVVPAAYLLILGWPVSKITPAKLCIDETHADSNVTDHAGTDTADGFCVIHVLQPYAGLLHFALWPACTTDCNCECPCLLCSQHHNHQRRELYLSSGQQQIPPLRDKASSILAPSTKDQSMPTSAMKVGHMLACYNLISDALLQACFCRTCASTQLWHKRERLWLLCQSHILLTVSGKQL